jgi:RNA polymerase sigma-70 factor (sigma-E family)
MMTAEMETDDSPVWADPLVQLYRDRYEPMVRLAYLMTGSRDVAEELVQDAFLNVHRSWRRVTNPNAYLRTAVVNACNSWGRRKTLELHRRPAPPDPAMLVADEMWDTLQVLPTRQRAAIVLRYYEDLPDAQIAELLGCREATVRTAIHRGLARLRKEIDQ